MPSTLFSAFLSFWPNIPTHKHILAHTIGDWRTLGLYNAGQGLGVGEFEVVVSMLVLTWPLRKSHTFRFSG